MRRLVVIVVSTALLVAAAWAPSGQQQVSRRLLRVTGDALTGCSILRDGRIGFGLSGGFDSLGCTTGPEGRFRPPLANGLNTLLFRCPGVDTRKRVLVVRGDESERNLSANGEGLLANDAEAPFWSIAERASSASCRRLVGRGTPHPP